MTFLEHQDIHCPQVGGPVKKNWDSRRCAHRMAAAEKFEDNECKDCLTAAWHFFYQMGGY